MEPRVIPTSNRSTAARARVWRLQTDPVLCAAASRGNALAFSELYRRHYPALRAFVFHYLGARHRHEDAEDVVQDAFVRAFDAVSEQRFHGDFKRWLFTIARNRSVDLLRGERVRLVTLESARIEIDPVGQSNGVAAVAEAREEVAWLVAAIAELPERQRSALLLRELAGLSHEEIAEELGATTGSVRQLITRARDGVRDAAERDGREHASRRSRSLRTELLDSAPTLPLAAAGLFASAGTTVGGGFAIGKVAATILTALVVAGTAGTVSHEVSDANGTPKRAEPVQAAAAGGPPAKQTTPAEHASRPGARDNAKSLAPGRPKQTSHSAPSDTSTQTAPADSGSHQSDSAGSTHSEATGDKAPTPPQPVKKVVELPGKVVEHVTGGLDGSSSPGQVVGDVLGDVTDTLGEVTSGLLGGSGSH